MGTPSRGAERATGLNEPTVAGVWLRIALLATGLALVGVSVAGRGVAVEVVALLAVATIAGAAAPGTLLCGVVLGGVIAVEVALGGGDIGARVAATAALVHAVHTLAALAAVVPTAARVELAALTPSAVRYVAVEAVVLPLLVAARYVPADAPPAWVLGVLAVAAAVVAGAPALLAIRSLRRDDQ
jgi:hypothetical protein